MLSETATRWLVVWHAIVGTAAVAATTHWLVWLWPFRRGIYARIRAAKLLGVIAMVLYGLAMIDGMILYPTYKTRVKLEYLTNAEVVAADAAARLEAQEQLRARWDGRPPRALDAGAVHRATAGVPDRADRVARWFDVKEHWAALGLVLGVATLAVMLAWDPRRDGRGPLTFLLLGAAGTAAVAWLAAIVGLVTTATRSL